MQIKDVVRRIDLAGLHLHCMIRFKHRLCYINPCLISLSSSNLGFPIGPNVTSGVCVADDNYLLSSFPSGLQGCLDIVNHHARRHQITFNNKSKIVITGSKIDMAYFKAIAPWTLNGEKLSVVDDNEHLGLIVSGENEEQKNVDRNIMKC